MESLFSGKYLQSKLIKDYSRNQLLALSISVLKDLNWNIQFIKKSEIIALAVLSNNHKYEIRIILADNQIEFQSSSISFELFPKQTNKQNFLLFDQQLEKQLSVITRQKIEFLEQNLDSITHEFSNENLNKPSLKKSTVPEFLNFFIPKKNYFITPLLINLNILIFILMVLGGAGFFEPENQILLNWGANFRPLTVDGGEWWRLITSTFIHAGVFHLLMNMYALLYIGYLLEPILGRTRFAILYLLTGLCASTTSLFWHNLNVCIGASGAIFGMYGIFLAMLTTNIIEKTARKDLLSSIALFVGYNLLIGMNGNIDNSAHIGGLISGIIFGFSMYFSLKDRNNFRLRNITIFLSILITVGVILMIFNQLPKNFTSYDHKMKEIEKLENESLQLLKQNTTDNSVLLANLNTGITNWNKCNVIIDSINKLELPSSIFRDRTWKIHEYINLRIESFRIMKEGTLTNQLNLDLLKAKNKSIDSIIIAIRNIN